MVKSFRLPSEQQHWCVGNAAEERKGESNPQWWVRAVFAGRAPRRHCSGMPRVATAEAQPQHGMCEPQTAFRKQHNCCLQSACCARGFQIWPGPGPCLLRTSPLPVRLPQGLSLEEGLQSCPGFPRRSRPNDSPWAQPMHWLCKLQLLPKGIAAQPQSLRSKANCFE